MNYRFLLAGILAISLSSCSFGSQPVNTPWASSGAVIPQAPTPETITIRDWKSILTPEQYYVLREKGTERPFTGALLNEHRTGTYYSVGCDKPLFRSETKYESGTGWPSFYAPISDDALVLDTDYDLGYPRTEVLDTCGGHLGHVFDDGPEPSGKRYCMNSVALYFVPDKKQ